MCELTSRLKMRQFSHFNPFSRVFPRFLWVFRPNRPPVFRKSFFCPLIIPKKRPESSKNFPKKILLVRERHLKYLWNVNFSSTWAIIYYYTSAEIKFEVLEVFKTSIFKVSNATFLWHIYVAPVSKKPYLYPYIGGSPKCGHNWGQKIVTILFCRFCAERTWLLAT